MDDINRGQIRGNGKVRAMTDQEYDCHMLIERIYEIQDELETFLPNSNEWCKVFDLLKENDSRKMYFRILINQIQKMHEIQDELATFLPNIKDWQKVYELIQENNETDKKITAYWKQGIQG